MGNRIALCTSKRISTEARGGQSEQHLHPVGDDEKYGQDRQKRKDRSRNISRESKEAEDFSSSKPAVPCKNTGGSVVRVKLVIRKQELAKFLSNDLAKTAAMEDLLVELQAKLGDQRTALYEGNCGTVAQMSSDSRWRPSLESIAEDKN